MNRKRKKIKRYLISTKREICHEKGLFIAEGR